LHVFSGNPQAREEAFPVRASIRIAFILSILVMVGGGAVAIAAPPAGCVKIIGVSVDPPSGCPGQSFTVAVSVQNCGTHRDLIVTSVTAMGPDGGAVRSAQARLAPGETAQMPCVIETSPSGTPGSWSVSVQASSRRGGSDAAATGFDVVPCP